MDGQAVIIMLSILCFFLILGFVYRGKTIQELEEKERKAKSEKYEYEKKQKQLQQSCDNLENTLLKQRESYYSLAEENKGLAKTCDKYSIKFYELKRLKELHDKREEELQKILQGHKQAYPYLAGIMADYTTYDIKILADKLDWGSNKERAKKVASINSIRASAEERIAEAKVATYQLNYLLSLYPALEDVLDTEDYTELDYSDKGYLQEDDPVRRYLSKEEWLSLSEDERNQKALDNYIESHTKSKWQIGRDYELYIGYLYETKGYRVTYYGETKGLEDFGRDLICERMGKTQIVQCKYWSKDKTIHEKHIFQLFATTVSYCIDNHISMKEVSPVFVTNICLSANAMRVAEQLNVTYVENKQMGDFPRIKCNNEKGEFGYTKIYHLPMDQQYDRVLLNSVGDMKVFTVQEAVNAGYRRAYKWRSNA